MHAQPGDWLVVKSGSDARHSRRAEIISVSPDGVPPYTVRWLDTGHQALLYPGPDAEVVTAERQLELDRKEAERTAQLQAEMGADGMATHHYR